MLHVEDGWLAPSATYGPLEGQRVRHAWSSARRAEVR